MGAKILQQYTVVGPYAFANILDAPSNEVISKVAVELGSRGPIQTMTLPAILITDFIQAVKK